MPEFSPEETLKGIDESIGKWKRIVYHDAHSHGAKDCKLCQMFNPIYCTIDCYGCPIRLFSGIDSCNHTPYIRATISGKTKADENLELTFLYEVRLSYLIRILKQRKQS